MMLEEKVRALEPTSEVIEEMESIIEPLCSIIETAKDDQVRL
jgi:hypothetical protein